MRRSCRLWRVVFFLLCLGGLRTFGGVADYCCVVFVLVIVGGF